MDYDDTVCRECEIVILSQEDLSRDDDMLVILVLYG